MPWWSSPASRARGSPRWRSAPCTRSPSGATWNPSRRMRGASSIRRASPTSIRSPACRRRWPCSSSGAVAAPGRRSAASRRSPAWCACCTPGRGSTRTGSRCSTPRTSRRTRSRAPARNATGSVASTTCPRRRWSPIPRSRSASARSPPIRRPGTVTSCETCWSPWATTSTCRGRICPGSRGTGSCTRTRPRSFRCTPGSPSTKRAPRSRQESNRPTPAPTRAPVATCSTRSRTRRARR